MHEFTKKRTIIILVAVAFIAGIGGGSFYAYKKEQDKTQQEYAQQNTTNPEADDLSAQAEAAGDEGDVEQAARLYTEAAERYRTFGEEESAMTAEANAATFQAAIDAENATNERGGEDELPPAADSE